MSALTGNEKYILIVRLVIGMVLVVASIDKIADPNAFARSILNYKLVGESVSLGVATVLPWMEFLCGFAILAGVAFRGGSALAALMFAVFTVGIVSALARGLDISCGCFTQDPAVGKVSWMKVAENILLTILSVFLLISNSATFTLASKLRSLRQGPPDIPA